MEFRVDLSRLSIMQQSRPKYSYLEALIQRPIQFGIQTLHDVMRDGDRCRDWAERAYEQAQRYTAQRMVRAYLAVYAEVMAVRADVLNQKSVATAIARP